MPTALFHIRKYLDQNATKCKIEYIEPEKMEQNQIFILDDNLHTEQQQNEGTIDEQQQPLCKDFSSLRREIFFALPSASPQSSNAWSPSMSPSTSGVFSTSNPNASPPGCSSPPHSPSPFILDELLFQSDNRQSTASPILNASAPNELEPDDPNELEESLMELKTNADDDAERNKEERKLRRKIVENILKLISNFSHLDERKSIFLLKSEILDVLIRYISEAPEMHEQLARALRRLARHQTGLEILLAMDFNWMVITHLIRRPCILARHFRRCARCDIRCDIGRSMLADHELLADSSMGEYVLLKVKMDAAVQMPDLEKAKCARLKILMDALMLFDNHIRRHNFYYNFRPIDALLGELSRILKEEELSEETQEGRICRDILATFGRIISKNHHRLDFDPYLNARDGFEELSKNMEKCILEDESNSEEAKLKFKNKEGQLMVEVPKKELCTWNEYFSGMFNSEFIERVEGRDQFEFDSEMEGCSEQEFITFLHFSMGCPLKSECVRISYAECCAALLYLADKYLCTRLLDHLLANKKAARFINGKTLQLFLPLVLSVPTIADGGRLKNISIFVLLCNSSNSELISTLCHIQKCDSGKGRIIDALMTTIHDFIVAYAGP